MAKRLFFAASFQQPDNQAAYQQLRQLKHRLCGRHGVPDNNLHMTLAFIGNVDDAQQQRLIEKVNTLAFYAFTLRFTHLGYWKRSKIRYLSALDTPATLAELSQQLYQTANALELCPMPERGFIPHITLQRRANAFKHAFTEPEITFHVKEFGLYSSELSHNAPRYQQIKAWSLIK